MLVGIIMSKAPEVQKISLDKLRRFSKFLISEVGLEKVPLLLTLQYELLS
jgi:hypothetical protein